MLVEYAIMRNGEYVVEMYDVDLRKGEFAFSKHIEDATCFPSAENAEKFVEDDMRLNIANVSIHRVTHQNPIITPLVKVNGVFVDINTVFNCNVCSKWFPMNESNMYRVDLESDTEELCNECFEEIDNKYSNILDEQFGKPIKQFENLINSLGVRK